MNPSPDAFSHDQESLSLTRPLRLVSNALMVLCLLALSCALPVILGGAQRAPDAAVSCRTGTRVSSEMSMNVCAAPRLP